MADFKLKQIVIDCSDPATIQQALSRFDEYADHIKNEPDESPIVLDSLSMFLLNQRQYPYTQVGMTIALKQHLRNQHKSKYHQPNYSGWWIDTESNGYVPLLNSTMYNHTGVINNDCKS